MRLLTIIAVALTAIAVSPVTFAAEDKVIMVESDDAEMSAAIAKARSTIGEFWRQFEESDAGVSDFALKVRIEDRNGVEFFWLTDIERDQGKYSGKIDNDPGIVKNVKFGQRYSFADGDIADWSFMRNGKIVGNETMRPLLKHMSAEEAAGYRDMLETP